MSGTHVSLPDLIQLKAYAKHINLNRYKKLFTTTAGTKLSVQRGRGIEFEEVRAYMPGDDCRNMDWRVTARTGKAHTRIFREEHDRPFFIVVDSQSSMHFGTQVAFKSVIAAKIAALLAWAAHHHHDRVGGILFNENDCDIIKPSGSNRSVLNFLKQLSQLQASDTPLHPQSLATALGSLNPYLTPGSLIAIISDFNQLSQDSQNIIKQLATRHQVLCTLVYDKIERFAPPPGRYTFSDGKQFLTLDTHSKQLCQAYQHRFEQNVEQLQRLCQQNYIPYFECATDTNITSLFRDFSA